FTNIGIAMGQDYASQSQGQTCILTLQDSASINIPDRLLDFSTTAASAVTTVNLNGGSITLAGFTKGNLNTASTLNLNGGTLIAGTNAPNFLDDIPNTSAVVRSGGARVHTNNFAVTIAKPF